MRRVFLLFFFLIHCFGKLLLGQGSWQVSLEEDTLPQAWSGIHSFAWGHYDGKWLFVAGRKNGLHGFNQGSGFPSSGINRKLFLVDPITEQVWSLNTDSLPDSLREPLQSANMQFFQQGEYLYVNGGYGWSNTQLDFITYPTLTALHLPSIIDSVMSGGAHFESHIRQITDSALAICGAHMMKLDSVIYLPWGHLFDGVYARNDTSGTFVQKYSLEVRRFTLQDDGTNMSINWMQAWRDTSNFRRRDYNLVPQIFSDGSRGFTGFTGVFRKGINLPWLNVVDISPTGTQIVPVFNQLLSQYHSAVMPVFDSIQNQMSTYFFGGMSQYYYNQAQTLVGDSLVPFVKTISRVMRDGAGNLSEAALDISMPGYLGSNAVFIPSEIIPVDASGILHPSSLTTRTLAGYIIGGIDSPDPNISDTDPSLSIASPRFFKVYLEFVVNRDQAKKVVEPVAIRVFPNPFSEKLNVEIKGKANPQTRVSLHDMWGRELKIIYEGDWKGGKEIFTLKPEMQASSILYIIVQTESFSKAISVFPLK